MRYDDEYDDDDEQDDAFDDDDVSDDSDDDIPEPGHHTDPGVEISMEVDEHGNEMWYASDSRIPGSTSMGHSVEEAVDGVEDRRREYREIIRKSREERARDTEDNDR
jgi:hypothetical protein